MILMHSYFHSAGGVYVSTANTSRMHAGVSWGRVTKDRQGAGPWDIYNNGIQLLMYGLLPGQTYSQETT